MATQASRSIAYLVQSIIPGRCNALRANPVLHRSVCNTNHIHRSVFLASPKQRSFNVHAARHSCTMKADTPASDNSEEIPLPSPIAVIGAGGNMGTALIKGIVSSPGDTTVIASSRNRKSMAHLPLSEGDIIEDNIAAVSKAEVVIISVKPNVAPSVLRQIALTLAARTESPPVLMSVVAGLTTETLSDMLGAACKHVPVVRCMPNTPSGVGAGCTAICGDGGATESASLDKAEAVLRRVGIVERLTEGQFNAATALAGCGVAYLFMAAEALADAGVRYGLGREAAKRMAAATVEGAGKLLRETGEHPAVLRNKVESPGGVTVAATARLEEDGFRAAIGSAVDGAVERLMEMEAEAETK